MARKLFYLLYPALSFVALIWIIFLFENALQLDWGMNGVYPRHLSGLFGVLFMPLLHGSFEHIVSNTAPSLVLITAVFYWFPTRGKYIIGFIWIMGGFWLWIMGREVYHIGASGIIYGMVFFFFVKAFLTADRGIRAFAMLQLFLYGSSLAGIFPLQNEAISWEGHLCGALAGATAAFYFREKIILEKKEEPADEYTPPDFTSAEEVHRHYSEWKNRSN